MNISEYFENTKGLGVLATADGDGNVNAAVYARPHVMDEETLAFIMLDRLSHHNLQSNPHAAYLFREERPGYRGKRFHMTKIREEQDTELLNSLRRKVYPSDLEGNEKARFLVFFKIRKVLPLIGPGDSGAD